MPDSAIKVLHLSTADSGGGASLGAYSLHSELCKSSDLSSLMLVDKKLTSDDTVHTLSRIDHIISRRIRSKLSEASFWGYKKAPGMSHFTACASPLFLHRNIQQKIKDLDPDIIHIHWIGNGFINPEMLTQFDKPLIWTLRDCWAFTGGCHYPGACTNYLDECGNCVCINSTRKEDLSSRLWNRKFNSWSDNKITLVAPSHWLAKCAGDSKLFRGKQIQIIPIGINETIFSPNARENAEVKFNLSKDIKRILFVSVSGWRENRKGFEYLLSACRLIFRESAISNFELIILGHDAPATPINSEFAIRYLGKHRDQATIAYAYNAADVTVVPSIQEGFGKVVIESMSCGTPVVAFNCTGIKDIIEHQKTGYLAASFDSTDLAAGIKWALEDTERSQILSRNCRETVLKNFTLQQQAKSYKDLYYKMLKS